MAHFLVQFFFELAASEVKLESAEEFEHHAG
jgi:hypothetical protein